MYTYNKNDKSYTFSTDELDIESIIKLETNNDINSTNENEEYTQPENTNQKPRKIEIINGGNDLDISPVSNHLEIEKPKTEKKENIIIPENNKD